MQPVGSTVDSASVRVCDHVELAAALGCAIPASTSDTSVSRAAKKQLPVSSTPVITISGGNTPELAKQAFAAQTEKAKTSSNSFVVRRKWKAKEQALRLDSKAETQSTNTRKRELRKLKEDYYVSAFLDVAADTDQNNVKATLILDQVTDYKRKRPTWTATNVRYCIILRNLCTKAYEYIVA